MTEIIEPMPARIDQQHLAPQLVETARAEGVELVGPGGLLAGLTKTVLETALEAEMTEHLGYDSPRHRGPRRRELPQRHPGQDGAHRDRAGADRGAAGSRRELRPGDRQEASAPVGRHRRNRPVADRAGSDDRGGRGALRGGLRREGLQGHHLPDHRQGPRGDDRVAEPAPRLRSTRCCSSTRSTSRSATARSATGRSTWPSGSPSTGTATSSGIWAGDGGEGAKYWLQVLTEIKNRGVADVCIVVCDGLKGLPDSINTVWPAAMVQACVLHLIRNTFRYASRRSTGSRWPRTCARSTPRPPKPPRRRGSTSSPRTGAGSTRRSSRCGARPGRSSCRSWTTTWRSGGSSAPPTPSRALNARYRRAVKARGHFPTEQAALKCLYLVTRSLDPTGRGPGPLGGALEARTQRLRDHLRRPYRPHQRKLAITTGYTVPQTPPDGVPRNRPTSSRRLRTPTLSKTALRWSCRV